MTTKKVQKWKEDYTEYGFAKTIIIDGENRLQYMLCDALFSNLKL